MEVDNNKMKRTKLTILIFLSVLLFSACDERRNEIIAHMLVSPTMTDTPLPPTETPTIAPTLPPTPTPTPYFAAENMDLLLFGDYDLADYNLKSQINNTEDINEILQAQTNLLELSYLREDYAKYGRDQ